MKIYSRKGDKGDTSLFNGKIVKKHNLRVDAYGTIDELNSFIGLLKDYIEDEKIKDLLNRIQIKLFSIGSFLSAINKEGELSNKVKIEFNEQNWKKELLTLLQNLSKSNE